VHGPPLESLSRAIFFEKFLLTTEIKMTREETRGCDSKFIRRPIAISSLRKGVTLYINLERWIMTAVR
jgi:hypothetical protein